jgi:2-polyprenyl-6-methoxyphenol hydroxylase-like FAD-dependent oxidoreductase
MLSPRIDVIIVGAGPVGLALGAQLTQAGFRATVIDDQAAGANTSRAAVVHARTLEVLTPLSVTNEMVAAGIKVPLFTVRDRDEILMAVDFSHLETHFPYALMLSQAKTEQILLDRLLQLGGKILRPQKVVAISQDEHGVTATMASGTKLRAQLLVGADGMHSTVRQKAGISFVGGSYKESFSLADVMMSGDVPDREVILYFSPDGLVVVAPLPDGSHRIVASVNNAPETPDVPYIQHLLDTRGPRRKRVKVDRVIWGSRFHVHHRVATHYRSGRVFLAGDAAHVHSPAGGQGMNTGIQDAIALGQTITAAMASVNLSRLDDYENERRPIALRVVALTDRLTRIATTPKLIRPLRNALLHAVANIPTMRSRLAVRLAGLSNEK